MKQMLSILVAAAMAAAVPAVAQNTAPAAVPTPVQAAEPANAASVPDYPGLGDIMLLQQLHHIKLWYAGQAGNWALADYEAGELGDGFENINKLLGGDLVDTMVGAQMQDLQKAIDAKNGTAFMAAYDSLGAGCNNCHHALDHAFIVIQRPTVLPYSDQSFAPPK